MQGHSSLCSHGACAGAMTDSGHRSSHHRPKGQWPACDVLINGGKPVVKWVWDTTAEVSHVLPVPGIHKTSKRTAPGEWPRILQTMRLHLYPPSCNPSLKVKSLKSKASKSLQSQPDAAARSAHSWDRPEKAQHRAFVFLSL